MWRPDDWRGCQQAEQSQVVECTHDNLVLTVIKFGDTGSTTVPSYDNLTATSFTFSSQPARNSLGLAPVHFLNTREK